MQAILALLQGPFGPAPAVAFLGLLDRSAYCRDQSLQPVLGDKVDRPGPEDFDGLLLADRPGHEQERDVGAALAGEGQGRETVAVGQGTVSEDQVGTSLVKGRLELRPRPDASDDTVNAARAE